MTEQLTREQVLVMEPGRELDALVEHEVIGTRRPAKGWSINPRHYSTDISAAWDVVRKLSKDYGVEVYEDDGAPCMCNLYRFSTDPVVSVEGETVPESISKSALLAVMGL